MTHRLARGVAVTHTGSREAWRVTVALGIEDRA